MRNLFISLFLMMSISIFAQNSITGIILDQKTQEPISGMIFLIEETGQKSITDIDGKFIFKNIQLPEVTLKNQTNTYSTYKKHIIFTNKHIHLKILLEKKVFDLDAVIVSTPFSKLQKDNVMKVNRRSVNEMEKNGVQNLMEGISQIPGVSNLSTGTGINKPVIRGLTGNRVLVFDQGMRVENYQFGEEHGMGIDEAGINAVEVIKGPASLLYGSDALGGVIYLVPEKFAPQNQSKFDAKFQYFSNTQGKTLSSGYKKSWKKLKILFRGSAKQNGDYQIPDNLFAENTANNAYNFKTGINYQSKKFKSELRYSYNQQQNGLATGISSEYHSSPIDKYQKLTNNKISLTNELKWAGSSLHSNLGFTAHSRAVMVNEQSFIGMNLNTWNWDLKWDLPSNEKFQSIVGMQNMYQTNQNFGQHFLLPNAEIFNSGIFTTVNVTWDKISLQTGLRTDFRKIKTQEIGSPGDADYREAIDKKLHSFTGAIGVKMDLNDNFVLRTNLAKGFRAPNLAELTSNGLHDNRVEYGNPNLKNEENLQTDVNLSYTNNHFEFFVNGFYNKINNHIFLSPTRQMQNNHPIYQYEQDDAHLYGGEAGLHLHPHPWDWLHYDTSFETVTGKRSNGEYLPLIPVDQWKNKLKLKLNANNEFFKNSYVYVSANHFFEADKTSDFEEKYPAYTLINFGVGNSFGWKKYKISYNLSVHNLTDKKYISNLSVLREENIPNPGRNIILTLKVKI